MPTADFNLDIFYMNTKRKPDPLSKKQAGLSAQQAVRNFNPDVIITADDNAQTYVAKAFIGVNRPKVVFCGVNADPLLYGFPASNVTGIVERPHFVQSFQMLQIIDPGARTIAVITDDSTTSDQLIKDLKTKSLPLAVKSIDQPATFMEWQQCIQRYQHTVDAICIIVYHTIKITIDSTSIMLPEKVMAWTVDHNTKPLFSVAPFGVEEGALFGIVNSGHEQGLTAAKITRQLLSGIKAEDIPVVYPEKGAVYLNIKTADKMGFDIPFHIIQSTDKIID
ncbi:MAG: hypothetical protein HKM93_08165 [Desulfobacteraceae bacterium]|nr:hypothetical protein [Desulfobacteraceae bacterium]